MKTTLDGKQEQTQEQKANYSASLFVLLGQQLEGYKELDENAPREVRLAALGVLGMAESFAIVSFNKDLLEDISKVRSKVIASLRPRLELSSKSKGTFQIYYAKCLPVLPFLTADFFLETHYHDLGELEAERLEAVYGLLNDPKDKAFIKRCEALDTHVALSVGDVVRDSNGRYWLCQNLGWKELLKV